MIALFQTDINCKACLDNTLTRLLSHTATQKLFWKENSENDNYQILIKSKASINVIRALIIEDSDIRVNLLEEKELEEKDFKSEKSDFRLYDTGFWD